jgi:hypothetical protein
LPHGNLLPNLAPCEFYQAFSLPGRCTSGIISG